jgi:hypothetical protein
MGFAEGNSNNRRPQYGDAMRYQYENGVLATYGGGGEGERGELSIGVAAY